MLYLQQGSGLASFYRKLRPAVQMGGTFYKSVTLIGHAKQARPFCFPDPDIPRSYRVHNWHSSTGLALLWKILECLIRTSINHKLMSSREQNLNWFSLFIILIHKELNLILKMIAKIWEAVKFLKLPFQNPVNL